MKYTLLDKYIEYVRDNPNHLWFKRKWYGWGWTPVTWQGWLSILFAVALIIRISSGLSDDPSQRDLVIFFGKLAVVIGCLIWLCIKKGETPRWQWGVNKNEHE